MMEHHDEMRDLVAAYALDALEGDEVDQVEEHLRFCPRCRAELASYHETAVLLAYTGERAPAGLWERIVAELDPPVATPPAQPLLGARRRSASRRRLRAAAWAAVAASVAGLGGVVAHDSARIAALDSAATGQSLVRQLAAAAIDPGARRAALVSVNGPARADAIVLGDGRGYLVASDLAPLPDDRTYQLWAIVAGKPVSAGLLGSHPGINAFRADPHLAGLAVTDEPAGGSRQPTAAPVAAGGLS